MIININLAMNKKEEPILRVVEANGDEPITIRDILLTTGFNVNKANDTLRLLNTGIEVKFENYIQYNDLVQEINHILVSNRHPSV